MSFGQFAGAQEIERHRFRGISRRQTRSFHQFLLNGERQIVRQAENGRANVSDDRGQKCPVQSAAIAGVERMSDGQVSPHGQQDGQPDGDGVEHLRDVSVNQHVHRPRVAEFLTERSLTQQIHVNCERDVLDHHQVVGHGQAGQNGVGRRDHILTRQHDDVQRVGQHSKDAHNQRNIAVNFGVRQVKRVKSLAAVLGQNGFHLIGICCVQSPIEAFQLGQIGDVVTEQIAEIETSGFGFHFFSQRSPDLLAATCFRRIKTLQIARNDTDVDDIPQLVITTSVSCFLNRPTCRSDVAQECLPTDSLLDRR